MDKIKTMYDALTVDESTKLRMIENAKTDRMIRPFPHRRVWLTAACVALIAVITAIPIAAGGGGFSLLQKMDKEISAQYQRKISSQKQADTMPHYDVLSRYAGGLAIGNTVCENGGVSFSPDNAYYDGTRLYLSFTGSCDRPDYERLVYTPSQDDEPAFLINGEEVSPTEGSFTLFRQQDGIYAGVISFTYLSSANELHFSCRLPYLQGMDADGEEPVGKPIEGPFNFDTAVSRTYTDNLTADGVGTPKDMIYISSVQSTPAALTVQFFVDMEHFPESSGADVRSNMQALAVTPAGKTPSLIEGSEQQVDKGVVKTQTFTPVDSDELTLIIYDKNDADGCGSTPCEKARFRISLS